MILYEDAYFYITKCPEYANVPGFFVIYENNNNWYSSAESINRLALLEKTIRDEFMKCGIELTGIYREENDNEFRVLIIPFDVKVLNSINISPDLYQPYIKEYLDFFKPSNIEYDMLDTKVLTRLRELKNE